MPLQDLTPPVTWRDRAWRAAYRAGYPVARLWWRLRKPPHVGALVAIYVGDSILLIRSSYRTSWTLPGGGVEPGETPAEAARRELGEEIGLTAGGLEPVLMTTGNWEGRPDQVHIFRVLLDRPPALLLDNREVTEARLVPLAELDRFPLTGPVQAFLHGRPTLLS